MICLAFLTKLRPIHRVSLTIALCIGCIACAQAVSAQSPDKTKWLVLKNGEALQGQIEVADGKHIVVADSGSRIVLSNDMVNFVADSIEDIYWEKWSRVDPGDGESHMRLFRWCLEHDLLDEAQKQIDLVSKLENMEGQVANLSLMAQELELVVARINKEALMAKQKHIESLAIRQLPALPETEKSRFAAVPTIPSTPIDANGRHVRKLEPMTRLPNEPAGKIDLVGFEQELQPTAPAKTETGRRDKPAWVSNRVLDRETRSMPNGTVSFYRRHIESKLIANCIQCHDSRSTAMPMNKRSFGQTIPRRMSQQNLHFVMEQVDLSDPLSSKLLSMAVTAHGKQEAASFKANEPFLFDLKKWTVAVSEDPAKWLMALTESSRQSPAAPPATATATPRAESFGPAHAGPSAAAAIEDANQIANEIIEVDPKPVADVDPYDPAAFNRK